MKSLCLTVFIYFLQLRTVHGLLFAMGNTQHADSQRQAGIALEVSIMPSPGRPYFPCISHFTHAVLRLASEKNIRDVQKVALDYLHLRGTLRKSRPSYAT